MMMEAYILVLKAVQVLVEATAAVPEEVGVLRV